MKKVEDVKGWIQSEVRVTSNDIIAQCAPERMSLVKNIGSSKARSKEQQRIGREVIENFIKEHEGKSIIAFTDGSIKVRNQEN